MRASIQKDIFNVSSIGAFEGMPMKTNSIPIWERQEFMKVRFEQCLWWMKRAVSRWNHEANQSTSDGLRG
jgi:hypothetical protein